MILTDTEIIECLTGGPKTVARIVERAVLEKLCAGVSMPEAVNNDLADDISAIDAMYRGDPTYEHDAYYMRKAAEKCVRKGYALYTADQLRAYGAACRVKALEDVAQIATPLLARPCDCEVCDCGNSGDYARVVDWDSSNSLAQAIRDLKGEAA